MKYKLNDKVKFKWINDATGNTEIITGTIVETNELENTYDIRVDSKRGVFTEDDVKETDIIKKCKRIDTDLVCIVIIATFLTIFVATGIIAIVVAILKGVGT